MCRLRSLLMMGLWWFCIGIVDAAELSFTPASPMVAVGEEISLSVAGASGAVTWSAQRGWIVGAGNEVVYKAPDQVGFDVVVVSDAAGNVATLKIQLLPKSNISEENAQWEVFSNLDVMTGFVPLPDGQTFLVKSIGGLAQFEVATGQLTTSKKGMFTQQDGLPDNQVTNFLADEDGVWIGTANGLAYYSNSTDKLTPYETPLGFVNDLVSDGHSGIWASFMVTPADLFAITEGKKPGFSTEQGHYYAVARLDVNKQWAVYPINNPTMTMVNDEHGGLWAITLNDGINKGEEDRGVLRHLSENGEWAIYTTKTLGLSGGFDFFSPESDGQGGIWVGMKGHVVHFNLAGEWKTYSAVEAGLSAEMTVRPSFMNEDGTLRVMSDDGSSRFDLSNDGIWKPVTINGPKGVFWSAYDGKGGLWMIANDLHLWYRDTNEKRTEYPDTSNYPYSTSPLGGDVPDGEGGVWVGTYGEGLVHLTKDGLWEKVPTSSKLPLSSVYGIGYDTQGGGWILGFQTSTSLNYDTNMIAKLVRCKPEKSGEKSELICNPPEQNLPPQITEETTQLPNLLPDAQGGLWLSSNNVGLFYRNSEGQWTTYDTTNSGLPSDKVWAIAHDGNGGLWIATTGGLAHLSDDRQWTIYNTSNSGLPNDDLFALETDSTGGIWIGIGGGDVRGLVYFSNQGEWTVYNTDNSLLPNNNVTALLKGENGGLWIGTAREKQYGGLVSYLSETGEWTTYPTDVGSWPRFFMSDQHGGVWAATLSSGLAHFDRNGKSIVFDSHNSGLPSLITTGLLNDGEGGLWASNQFGGIAHLTFPEKQKGKRAAIIIAAGGSHSENNLWEATESITNYIYEMLAARKFVNEEIYYLSSNGRADFNRDGYDDRVVDIPRPERPLVLDDIRQAFDWAKTRGKLDQPLYVFFMDHGGTEKLLLNKTDYMQSTDLKALLDDYQTATGSQVVLVIEACYSGSHLPILAAPNRAIITSASANELAYFDGKQGFMRFLTYYLSSASDFEESFELAGRDQNRMLGKRYNAETTQFPQLDDNGDGIYDPATDGQWLKQLKINGDLQMAGFNLTVENLTSTATITAGQPLPLTAKVVTAKDDVKLVWAIVRPPRMNRVFDTNGTPILAYPRENLSKTAEKDIYQTTWNNAIYNGDYEITFYAEDKQGNIAGSEESVTITVTTGIEPPPQAQVQIQTEKNRYQRGESFKATLTEDLGWGYDLYAAVVLPDGNFIALNGTNNLRPVNEAKPWYAPRKQGNAITLFDLTLPADLPTGQYCLYGILSPESNDPFEAKDKGLWVYGNQCFEVF